jgi:hypothetical protein
VAAQLIGQPIKLTWPVKLALTRPPDVRFRRSARCGETMASLTAIMKQSFINNGVPEAWERENE